MAWWGDTNDRQRPARRTAAHKSRACCGAEGSYSGTGKPTMTTTVATQVSQVCQDPHSVLACMASVQLPSKQDSKHYHCHSHSTDEQNDSQGLRDLCKAMRLKNSRDRILTQTWLTPLVAVSHPMTQQLLPLHQTHEGTEVPHFHHPSLLGAVWWGSDHYCLTDGTREASA